MWVFRHTACSMQVSSIKIEIRDTVRLHIKPKNASILGPWRFTFYFVEKKTETQGKGVISVYSVGLRQEHSSISALLLLCPRISHNTGPFYFQFLYFVFFATYFATTALSISYPLPQMFNFFYHYVSLQIKVLTAFGEKTDITLPCDFLLLSHSQHFWHQLCVFFSSHTKKFCDPRRLPHSVTQLWH